MLRRSFVSLLTCSAVVLCLGITGCKPSFPYYTTEGSMESRVVEVHVSDTQVIKVPCGKGMGGGLDDLLPDAEGIMTKEQDGVVVKLKAEAGGAVIVVKEVTYNGTKCAAYEEVL